MTFLLRWCFVACLITTTFHLHAQPQLLDQVEAVVGNKIVLSSDVEVQYLQARSQGMPDNNLRCQILEQLMLEKMLQVRAEVDSIEINEDEVNQELDSRINYFLNLFGGDTEKMEEYYGRTLLEIKEDFREEVRGQLLVRRMQSDIVGSTKTTPAEVKEYFASIPRDSLPYFNAEVELGELIIIPKISEEEKQKARQKLLDAKKQIEEGADFAKIAANISQDGSASSGGDLGWVSRGQFVPEFEGVAFKLKSGELSGIVETQFGFHLIQLIERRGDKIHTRHILIKPEITPTDLAAAQARADSLREVFLKDTLSFQEFVEKHSDDADNKRKGGHVYNPKDNTTTFEISELEPELYFAIEGLKEEEVSKAVAFKTQDGSSRYRLLYLYGRTKPHVANLTDDYNRIATAVQNQKQQQALFDWLKRYLPETYISVGTAYEGCETMQPWLQND